MKKIIVFIIAILSFYLSIGKDIVDNLSKISNNHNTQIQEVAVQIFDY